MKNCDDFGIDPFFVSFASTYEALLDIFIDRDQSYLTFFLIDYRIKGQNNGDEP